MAILCRNPETTKEAEKSIMRVASHPEFQLRTVACDLASLESIRSASSQLQKDKQVFDIVILNAGLLAVPEGTTKDGFESHIGVNHFGHFLLTDLLRNSELISENGRVIVLSSRMHRHYRDFDIHDLNWKKRKFSADGAYSASKSANILFTQELQRQFDAEGKGRIAVAVHPGFVRTKLMRETSLMKYVLIALFPLYWSVSLSPLQGTQCTLFAASTPDVASIKGAYLENLAPHFTPDTSEALAKELWQISVERTRSTTSS